MSDWYWLNADHSVTPGPSIDDRDEFTRYSIWLYGENGMSGTPNKQVGRDEFGSILVSTVFLGLDHGFGGRGPVLFETMVFDEAKDERECERYCTWDEAVEGHKRWCAKFQTPIMLDPPFSLEEIEQSKALLKKD